MSAPTWLYILMEDKFEKIIYTFPGVWKLIQSNFFVFLQILHSCIREIFVPPFTKYNKNNYLNK